jgi:Wiskott-Aldrich syndrome protein
MQTRQMDASAAARRHRRPRLQPASPDTKTPNGPAAGAVPPPEPAAVRRPAAETPNGPAAGAAPPPGPPAVRAPAAPVQRPRPAPPSRVAAFGARLARAPRLVPPVTVPMASCAPSHATSGGS